MYTQFCKRFHDAIRCLDSCPGVIKLPTEIPCPEFGGTWRISLEQLDTGALVLKALDEGIRVELFENHWLLTSIRFSKEQEQTELKTEVSKVVRFLETEGKKLTFSQAAWIALKIQNSVQENAELRFQKALPRLDVAKCDENGPNPNDILVSTADSGLEYYHHPQSFRDNTLDFRQRRASADYFALLFRREVLRSTN